MVAEVSISRLPVMPDLECELPEPKRITKTAPVRPSRTPAMRWRESCSAPTTAERISTRSGVVVLIIEPSIGEVLTRPNIIHSFRDTPIKSAATNTRILSRGSTLSCFSQSIGTSDHTEAITSEAETIAKGDM